MKTLKLLNPDTQCVICKRTVNRKRAEAEDWTKVTFCDNSGMAIKNEFVCQHCEDEIGKHYDKVEASV